MLAAGQQSSDQLYSVIGLCGSLRGRLFRFAGYKIVLLNAESDTPNQLDSVTFI